MTRHDPPLDEVARRVGSTLAGKYRLARLLGVGGMGAVFEATNTWTERRVAVKLMLGDAARDEELAARFLREARAASKVQHPHIVDVLDMGRDDADGTLYLVQEYLTGADLRRLLDERQALPPREALELLVPVMSALVAAHRAGVVHRDLKPENIFLARAPGGGVVPKLIDFGIAKLADDPAVRGLTRTGAAFGTPSYMSPEQARGERAVDAQTDVWAMGVVLYEVLTGRCPIEGDNYNQVIAAILTAPAPRIDERAPRLPRELGDVVHRALERDRARRYRTMAQFLGALLDCDAFERDGWHRTLRGAHGAVATDAARGGAADPSDELDRAETTRSTPADATPGDGPGPAPVKPNATTMGRTAREVDASRGGRGRARVLVGVAGVVSLGVFAALVGTRAARREAASRVGAAPAIAVSAPAEPATFAVVVAVRPATASIELDGVPVGVGAFARTLARDGAPHTLRLAAEGHAPQVLLFRDAPPPSSIELARVERDAPDAAMVARVVAGAAASARRGTARVGSAGARVSEAASPVPGEVARPDRRDVSEARPAPVVRTGVNGAPVLEQ